MSSELTAILFDVDDTLFDRRRAQKIILKRMVSRLPEVFAGLERGRILDAFLESDKEASRMLDETPSLSNARTARWTAFLSMIGLDARWSEKINAFYMGLYPSIVPPVPGAKRVVRLLASRYRLGVVSNGFRDIQYRKLERLGVLECFACVVLSDEMGIRKPDPAIFRKALEELREEPARCMYVGDSYEYDVLGAQAAGLRGCWLNRDRRSSSASALPQGAVKPCHEIRRLRELLAIVQRGRRRGARLSPCSTRR
jgi:HAD superfamily hydrolase (TIGR01509 family)